MTLDAWLAIGGVVAVLLALIFSSVPPYLVILGGVVAMLLAGVMPAGAAFSGFANEGMLTIAALFIVAAGINETGAVSATINSVLGHPKSTRGAQARVVAPVSAASAFLNNTPIVAMLMPVVTEWGKRIQVPASQLLIPLSYAAILGGICTLIGTSTNLVVHGLLLDSGREGLGMFEISRIGIPCAVVGVLFLVFFARRLLPRKDDALQAVSDPREYTMEMVVEPAGALVGKTIAQAGLRRLPGCYLMEIHRRGRVRAAVGPEERLDADDQLVFVGMIDSIVDLQKVAGLRPATTQLFKLDRPRSERWFVEAVISHSCPVVGKTIREGHFRSRYNAVVIGVARNGARIRGRIGDIVLEPGDVLLLEALPAFVEQQRNSTDFYLVSRIEGASPPNHEKRWIAIAILTAMVVVAATGLLSMLRAAIGAAALMLITRCCSEEAARRRVDWQVLIAIAASFGLGHAMALTGAADTVASSILKIAGDNATVALAVLYGVTMALSGMITNNATAVIIFPIAIATATQLGASPLPFVFALMIASSCNFASPLGYQTNLMVWGPGGYSFRDFVRIGLPLSILLWVVSVTLIPRIWPF